MKFELVEKLPLHGLLDGEQSIVVVTTISNIYTTYLIPFIRLRPQEVHKTAVQ
jgi:hypothetical protein